jgi:hypothetical protein
LNLPNSEDSGVTYLFEWGYTDTATVPPTDVVIDGFRAIVPRPTQIAPNTWLPVDLASLVPTGIQLGSLDATASRIARVIVEDPELRAKALQQFNLRGVFQPTQQYQYGDLVVVTGSPNQVWVVQTHGLVAPAAAVNTTQWLRLL